MDELLNFRSNTKYTKPSHCMYMIPFRNVKISHFYCILIEYIGLCISQLKLVLLGRPASSSIPSLQLELLYSFNTLPNLALKQLNLINLLKKKTKYPCPFSFQAQPFRDFPNPVTCFTSLLLLIISIKS